MNKRFQFAAIIATAAATVPASVGAASDPLAEAVSQPDDASESSICNAGEDQLLHASSTKDQFGYSIAVCVLSGEDGAQDTISVVLSGEGGNLRTSCLASKCDGVIAFNRYTRYRFTELTLKWRDQYSDHTLIEAFSAEDPDAEPQSSLTHYWLSDWQKDKGFEPEGEDLAGYEPLALMALERSLPDN